MKIVCDCFVCLVSEESLKRHRRLGHLNFRDLNRIEDRIGMKRITYEFCESSVLGKQYNEPFERNMKRAQFPLKLVYSNVIGPITLISYDEESYIVTLLDDYTHFYNVYLLKPRSSYHESLYKGRMNKRLR